MVGRQYVQCSAQVSQIRIEDRPRPPSYKPNQKRFSLSMSTAKISFKIRRKLDISKLLFYLLPTEPTPRPTFQPHYTATVSAVFYDKLGATKSLAHQHVTPIVVVRLVLGGDPVLRVEVAGQVRLLQDLVHHDTGKPRQHLRI